MDKNYSPESAEAKYLASKYAEQTEPASQSEKEKLLRQQDKLFYKSLSAGARRDSALASKLAKQIYRFTIVGFICFGIDYGLLLLLTEVFGLNYLVSNVIGFSVSVIANYYLSTKYVFDSRSGQFAAFVALSVAGLGLNELIMYVSPINYMITKFFATGVVMVFNFITRKLLLERKDACD